MPGHSAHGGNDGVIGDAFLDNLAIHHLISFFLTSVMAVLTLSLRLMTPS